MKKLTWKEIRKDRQKAYTAVLNCWYDHPDMLPDKHKAFLRLFVEF